MKKILIALTLCLAFGSAIFAAGASSPITGFSWDNIRKVIRFMTSDGQEIQVAEAPKQYFAGQTYNGVALVVSATSWTTTGGVFIPYRTSDGSWRLRFNLQGSRSPGSTNFSLSIYGVTFTGFLQAVTAHDTATGTASTQSAYAGSSLLQTQFTSATTGIVVSGDIKIDSKPLWAD